GLVGIVAIVYASQVNTLVQHGNYLAAQRASDNAKIWCWVTTIFAILGIPLTIFMMLLGVADSLITL
ncbi:MAG: CD225/dispanin family protein, partial [Pseudomonadota bacterium]|nr:CD225/dispanin family protein [Pseudomonadota bacterium]